jgi:hypothetical protein
MRFSLQSPFSNERRVSRDGTRACFLAVALLLLGTPLVQAAVSAAEHNALVDLYNSTNGASWTNHTNWMVAADECTWYGVTCDPGHTTVQQIFLPNEDSSIAGNNLSGSLPASLGSLASLQALALDFNQLSGSVPPQLGNLANLTFLALQGNQLSGSIPPQLGNLASLRYLNLSGNQLSGAIPAQLGNLSSLQYLFLQVNQLSGSIPAQLGNLTNLETLDLYSNQLRGSIPSELALLTSLAPTSDIRASDIRFNALYSTDAALTSFLNTKERGVGDWQSFQTIAPANLSTSGPTPNAITVNWSPILYTADSGFYQVKYSTKAGGPYTPFATTTVSKSSSSLTVAGLAPSKRYYFVVSTTTLSGFNNANTVTSGFSTEVSGLTANPTRRRAVGH